MWRDPPDLSTRAPGPEMMDGPCTFADFRDCLRDISTINRITFGFRPTLRWLERFATNSGATLNVVDVGCGDGEMLRVIRRWGERNRIALKLTGIDLNPFAIAAARELSNGSEDIEWITCNAFSYQHAEGIDIVISSLFTHHLTDEETIAFIKWMELSARRGWFINDLHRERVPYRLARLLVNVMRFHRFVRNDAPLSVARSFRPAEWERLCGEAGLHNSQFKIETWRPARLCVGRIK